MDEPAKLTTDGDAPGAATSAGASSRPSTGASQRAGGAQASRLRELGSELRVAGERCPAGAAPLIAELAIALDNQDPEELGSWSEIDLMHLIEQEAAIELATERDPALRRLDTSRAALIFAPIAVTWFGIAFAAKAYGSLPRDSERYQDASFISLWENGFDGHGFSLSLFQIGIADFLLILALIIVTVIATRRRAALESTASEAAADLRATLVRVQRAIVGFRLHGVTRFRSELTAAAVHLQELTAGAERSGTATREALQAGLEVLSGATEASEHQRAAVEALGARMEAVEAAVDRFGALKAADAAANEQHIERLQDIARAAAAAAQHAATAGPALQSSANEISAAVRRVDPVLAGTAAGIEAFGDRLREEREAQDRLLGSMDSLASRLEFIGTAAEALAGSTGSLQTTLATLGSTVSSASSSIPTAMSGVVNELGVASAQLRDSAHQHGEVVQHIGAITTSLEISLAQTRTELVEVLASLQTIRTQAGEAARSAAEAPSVRS